MKASGPVKTEFCALIVLLGAAAVMQLMAGDAGDKGWLLLAAKMWLEGGRLYVDIVEVNPPLIVWLYAVPVFLSLHFPFLPDYQWLALMGLAACALSVWLCAHLLRFHPAFDGKRRAESVLLLASLLIFLTGPLYFFDREHIMLVFMLPYVMRFLPAMAKAPFPARLRWLTGLMAGLAFIIKPYALIPFIVLQLLYVLRERSLAILWSRENLTVYAAGMLYLACICLLTPEYIQVILPMALATYSAFSRRLFGLFYGLLALILAGIALADFRPRHGSPFRRDIYYLAGLCLGLLFYALVNNGWGYTWHPLISMILLLTGWLYWEYRWLRQEHAAQGLPVKYFVFGSRACLISLFCNAVYMAGHMAVFFATPACDWSPDCTRNRPYLDYVLQHHVTSFGALSEDFHKWPSLTRLSGAAFETRYNALWMVPKLVSEAPDLRVKHQWIVENVALGLADDLDRRHPDIMFVDTSPEFFGYNFPVDLPAFFSGVPAFAKAWGRYRYADTIDRCTAGRGSETPSLTGCRYAIYRHIPAGRP